MDTDYIDPEARSVMLAWVAGFVTAHRGQFPTEPFLSQAFQIMPPQILDEALTHFNLRIDWTEKQIPYFRVAPPWEKV